MLPVCPDMPRIMPAGDTALAVDFGNRVDVPTSRRVLLLARRLDARGVRGIIETVPTIRSLIIYYEPSLLTTQALREQVLELLDEAQDAFIPARTWVMPICYDPALAPDLAEVAGRTGLSPAQVVELHSSVAYHVYMLGFLPGLAYLGDVPSELALPRRKTPRRSIAAGSVGIAGTLTCVYPRETPCGWHLIGWSPVLLWDLRRAGAALLAAGDKVTFKPLSLREYELDAARSRAGMHRPFLAKEVA